MCRAIGQIRDHLFGGGGSGPVRNTAAVTRQTVFGQLPTLGFPLEQTSRRPVHRETCRTGYESSRPKRTLTSSGGRPGRLPISATTDGSCLLTDYSAKLFARRWSTPTPNSMKYCIVSRYTIQYSHCHRSTANS